MTFICIFIGLAVTAVAFMFFAAKSGFNRDLKKLFKDSPALVPQRYHRIDFKSLPEPVQRYFNHVLPEGRPRISYARLKHRGRFKTAIDKPWSLICGEEYFTIAKPGFIWRGKTKIFTAIDQYISGNGRLKVFLYSVFRVADNGGVRLSQGELLRWLGESVWFPTALLPGQSLTWEAIDRYHAKLNYRHSELKISYIVTFNDAFEIVQIETSRHMGERLETWIGRMSSYKRHEGILIPNTLKATWLLDGKEFTYAVFYLTEIEYDKPEKYN